MALAALAHLLAESVTAPGTVQYKKSETVNSGITAVITCGDTSSEDTASRAIIEEADALFVKSLKADPCNANAICWYAKLLRRTGRLGQVSRLVSTEACVMSGGKLPVLFLNIKLY